MRLRWTPGEPSALGRSALRNAAENIVRLPVGHGQGRACIITAHGPWRPCERWIEEDEGVIVSAELAYGASPLACVEHGSAVDDLERDGAQALVRVGACELLHSVGIGDALDLLDGFGGRFELALHEIVELRESEGSRSVEERLDQ